METNGYGRARATLAWTVALGLPVPMAALALATVLFFSRGGLVPARHVMWGVGTGLAVIAASSALLRRSLMPAKVSLAATSLLVLGVGMLCETYHRDASRPGIGDPHEGRAVLVLVAELPPDTGAYPLYHTHRVRVRPCRTALRHRDLDAKCPDGRPSIYLQHNVEPATTDAAAALGRVNARQLVVGIHGFNVKPDEAARLTVAIDDAGLRGDAAPTVLAVVWPSEAYPQEYWRDAATTRSPVIARELVTVLRALQRVGQREVTVVPHSAGNVLFACALAQPDALSGARFRAVLSLNSDLPLDELPQYVERLGRVSDEVHLFVDTTDLSLRISALMNHSQPRAGQIARPKAEAMIQSLRGVGRLAENVQVVLHSMTGTEVSADDGLRHGPFWSSATVGRCVAEIASNRGQCLNEPGVSVLTSH